MCPCRLYGKAVVLPSCGLPSPSDIFFRLLTTAPNSRNSIRLAAIVYFAWRKGFLLHNCRGPSPGCRGDFPPKCKARKPVLWSPGVPSNRFSPVSSRRNVPLQSHLRKKNHATTAGRGEPSLLEVSSIIDARRPGRPRFGRDWVVEQPFASPIEAGWAHGLGEGGFRG